MTKDDSRNVSVLQVTKQARQAVSEQYGIWQVLSVAESYHERYQRLFNDTPNFFNSLRKLAQDICSISPMLFCLFALAQLWMGCQEAVKMHFSSQVLRAIERYLREDVSDYTALIYPLLLRLVVTTIAEILSWHNENVLQRLQSRLTSHFQMRIMKAKLGHDLTQSKDPTEQSKVTANQAWGSVEGLLRFFGLALTAFSQFTLIIHLTRRDSGGPLFALMCLIRPLTSALFGRDYIWDKVCIVRNNNEDHQRMKALVSLTNAQYRQDVISNNLQGFIVKEYQKANKRLGDVPVKHVLSIFKMDKTPHLPALLALLGDLPIAYCGLLALFKPKATSFASIAILQESSTLLVLYVSSVLNGTERLRKNLSQIHEIYRTDTHYTSESPEEEKTLGTEDAELRAGQGMRFDLSNASFNYPGSQTTKSALRNINLTIKPGQFVMLVGSNGSGKSTLVKLLLRLHTPSDSITGGQEPRSQNASEQILIDNKPAASYPESYLRQSMAVLNQDNLIYPGFSLGENIGLGFSPLVSDEESINIAAKKAGAKGVLERMKDGANTVLDPQLDYYQFNVKEQDKSHPLKKVLEELRRPVEVSGGEKQRIVAARTFMKFSSGTIRFLAVDEPSSALDAEAEDFLLDNLLKEREGKTVVFVTHRFGKLSKQADLIVCMKEGTIVESGTHDELMKNDGEYRKLYDIQACAFRD